MTAILDKLDMPWKRAVSIATDGTYFTVQWKTGYMVKLRSKTYSVNPGHEL